MHYLKCQTLLLIFLIGLAVCSSTRSEMKVDDDFFEEVELADLIKSLISFDNINEALSNGSTSDERQGHNPIECEHGGLSSGILCSMQ